MMGKGPPEVIHTFAFQPFGLAWKAGIQAYRAGKMPYDHPHEPGSDEHGAWIHGYWYAHMRAVTGR